MLWVIASEFWLFLLIGVKLNRRVDLLKGVSAYFSKVSPQEFGSNSFNFTFFVPEIITSVF